MDTQRNRMLAEICIPSTSFLPCFMPSESYKKLIYKSLSIAQHCKLTNSTILNISVEHFEHPVEGKNSSFLGKCRSTLHGRVTVFFVYWRKRREIYSSQQNKQNNIFPTQGFLVACSKYSNSTKRNSFHCKKYYFKYRSEFCSLEIYFKEISG